MTSRSFQSRFRSCIWLKSREQNARRCRLCSWHHCAKMALLACVLTLALAIQVGSQVALSQTPWQAAPATPAPLPHKIQLQQQTQQQPIQQRPIQRQPTQQPAQPSPAHTGSIAPAMAPMTQVQFPSHPATGSGLGNGSADSLAPAVGAPAIRPSIQNSTPPPLTRVRRAKSLPPLPSSDSNNTAIGIAGSQPAPGAKQSGSPGSPSGSDPTILRRNLPIVGQTTIGNSTVAQSSMQSTIGRGTLDRTASNAAKNSGMPTLAAPVNNLADTVATPAFVPLSSRPISQQPTGNSAGSLIGSFAEATGASQFTAGFPPTVSASASSFVSPNSTPSPPPIPNLAAVPKTSAADARRGLAGLEPPPPRPGDWSSQPSPEPGAPNQLVSGTAQNAAPQQAETARNSTATPAKLVSSSQPAAQDPEEFPAGKLIAVVGTEHVLAGDMAVFVEPIIEQNRSQIASAAQESKIRSQITRQALRQYVEIKAIYQEFFRDMVGNASPKEMDEMKKKVTTRAGKIFYEKQVPVLIEKYGVTSASELELKLLDKKLSLHTLRNQFIEQVLASELERKYVPDKFEIDRQDLLAAFRDPENQKKWIVPGRARWRQLTVRFDKHASLQEVEQKISRMGDEIYLGGKSFDAVAKQESEGFTASEGGLYDWTTQGSLKSKELDAALFSENLPLNRLSRRITDDIGIHIIEVLEREPGYSKDFTQVQAELREQLSNEKRMKEARAFRRKIMDRTTVWTLWPEDIENSRPLSEALGNAN